MKAQITQIVSDAVATAVERLSLDAARSPVRIERTRDPRHGDFACNIAMVLAKAAKRNPRELAQSIVQALPETDWIEEVDIAGPGFINFRLHPRAYHRELIRILDETGQYGRSDYGAGHPILVEFVSANPTGPLHVGHGRLAAYGATVANLLQAIGHPVHREYYVNDAGRQMDILTVSTWLRYLEQGGQQIIFPSNGYRGRYVFTIAETLREHHGDLFERPWQEVATDLSADAPDGDKEVHIDAMIGRARMLLDEEGFQTVLDTTLHVILEDIREDLQEFGVTIDEWFSERTLKRDGFVERALQRLHEHDQVYKKDGALWFKSSAFGDEKDRVIVRENGQATYIASDVAYHLNKRERGFATLLDVLGADHHGYVARVRAGLRAMDESPDILEVRLVQFAVLYRGGEKVQMSTRSGEFVTLRELREEVGNDAARFFYVMRSNDQHLDFDLELAKSRTQDNPVFYIQYAHARVCRVFDRLTERGLSWDRSHADETLDYLDGPHERKLLFELSRYPEVVELAALNRAPQQLVHYLQELATTFHAFYNSVRILDDETRRDARLALAEGAGQITRNGLALLGVSAPDKM